MVSALTFTAVGDCIITRKCSHRKDPAFIALVDLIRKADVAFANLELVIPRPPVIPSSEYGGMHLGAEEFVLDELSWIGFNMFNIAHNHAIDYTFHGMLDTINALQKRGLTYAGGGMNLGEARSPGYLETNAGRAALIAAAASFMTGAHAAAARPDMPGRPGINPLRIDREFVLDAARMAALADIDRALGTNIATERRRQFDLFPDFKEGVYKFLGFDFVTGDTPGMRQKPKQEDLDDICKWIGDARRQADFVVTSLHVHHGPNGDSNCPEIAEFLPEVTHRFIDAGADVFVGHGPHMLRPIEVYRGKPIFYSLGNFFFAYEGIRKFPSEMYERHKLGSDATPADVFDAWERGKDGKLHAFAADDRFYQTVLPLCRFESGQLAHMELYPVTLCREAPRTRRGEPELALGDLGQQILEYISRISEPFGVRIKVEREGDQVKGLVTW